MLGISIYSGIYWGCFNLILMDVIAYTRCPSTKADGHCGSRINYTGPYWAVVPIESNYKEN